MSSERHYPSLNVKDRAITLIFHPSSELGPCHRTAYTLHPSLQLKASPKRSRKSSQVSGSRRRLSSLPCSQQSFLANRCSILRRNKNMLLCMKDTRKVCRTSRPATQQKQCN